jgi:F-type H+-transporting ATPase subunit delta
MVRKRREPYLFEIATCFLELYKSYQNILTVKYKSPVPPAAEIRNEVTEVMKKFTKMDIELQEEIDESLIGGFILSWKELQYDASIRRELDELRNAIAKVNLYKKKGFLGNR